MRRPLPEHDLIAGSRGAVLIDHTKYIDKGTPPAYEVEFMDNAGVTLAVITVPEDNLEVVWRARKEPIKRKPDSP
jgi:hypothetical protein